MPLYIGDYLRDTQHLNAEKHGAYLMLIFAYWASGRALPDDDEHLATIARVPLRRWREIRPTIERFFQPGNGEWHHKRVDAELERSRNISAARADAGRTAAGKRWARQTHASRIADAQQNDTPSQSQSQVEEESDANASPKNEGNGHDRRSRGTRLPAGWKPDPHDREFAASLGLDPDRAAAEFRDYWAAIPGSKGIKLDWSATWRNRCRQLAERGGGNRPPTAGVVAAIRGLRLAGEGG